MIQWWRSGPSHSLPLRLGVIGRGTDTIGFHNHGISNFYCVKLKEDYSRGHPQVLPRVNHIPSNDSPGKVHRYKTGNSL